MSEENNEKKIKLSTFIYGLAAFFAVFFIVSAVFVYRSNGSKLIPDFIYNKIFYPAVIIGGNDFISIGSINENLLAVRKFYESQDFSSLGLRFDFSTEDGKKRLKIREKELINKMIEDRIIEEIAKEKGIKISKKTISSNVGRKMDEYGNREAIEKNLKDLYGWEVSDFEEKIVKPSLYKDELEKWLAENDGKNNNNKSKELSEEALGRIKKGENFSEVARSVSEGKTAEMGGKLGWFREDQIAIDIRSSVVALEKDETSDVLESKLGYHIIKMDDIRDEDGVKIYNISQIFFPKMSFALWLDEKIKNTNVVVLLTEYNWDKESGTVKFKDNKMEEFEKESMNKAEKDASLMAL